MAAIQVLHNPQFLDYDGDHNQIVPPVQPVASVQVADNLPLEAQLAEAYARTQHGYLHASWFKDPAVIPHLRSTSVGDLIALPDGASYVVESMGFRPFQPKPISPFQRLAAAYQQLDEAVTHGSQSYLRTAVQESLRAMRSVLDIAGKEHPLNEMPILWEKAQVGDVVGTAELGQFRVIARKLHPKYRARRLLAHIPQGAIWIDGPQTWAVLVPVGEVVGGE